MKQEMQPIIKFCLSYGGNESDNHQIDFYDVSQALTGFQRSIALTTHLVINGEIITKATALKGARIFTAPPREGSWEIVALVLIAFGTAPKDSPLGRLVHSVYDYVVSDSLGSHIIYDRTIGKLVKKHSRQINIDQNKVDLLSEKCSQSIADIHRPIFGNNTATNANIIAEWDSRQINVGPKLTSDTFDYIHGTFTDEKPVPIKGRVTSYNSRSYKGRISMPRKIGAIPFELEESCRTKSDITIVTTSLSVNALRKYKHKWSTISCNVLRNKSSKGHLKSYKILTVSGGSSVKR